MEWVDAILCKRYHEFEILGEKFKRDQIIRGEVFSKLIFIRLQFFLTLRSGATGRKVQYEGFVTSLDDELTLALTKKTIFDK